MPFEIPILLYHSISEDATRAYTRWNISPSAFSEQLDLLQEQGYTPLTISSLVSYLSGTTPSLPARPVAITIDDGLADFYSAAFPALARHRFPATLYIASGYVSVTSRWLTPLGQGYRPMLTWAQLREIADQEFEIGAHSHTHPQLDTLPLDVARREIFSSKAILQDQLGVPVTSFAYPHGYSNPAVRRLVLQAGFTSACAVMHAMSSPHDDRYALARIIITPQLRLDAFDSLLQGHGLPLAPFPERSQTRLWRVIRRSLAYFKRSLRLDNLYA
jgi:peptidoglycan/xylan/chitin deacetylase (PgdA/CDA1 family)